MKNPPFTLTARTSTRVLIGTAAPVPSAAPVRASVWAGLLPAASHVLQVGDDDGALERIYRSAHPDCHWQIAPRHESGASGRFELIVLVEGWWRGVADVHALLQQLAKHVSAEGQLFAETENQAQLSELQRWVAGDLGDTDDGPLARPARRHASPASLCKILMDAGWMPEVVRTLPAMPSAEPQALAAALLLAESVGTPAATAHRALCTGRFVVQAQRSFPALASGAAQPSRFAVVVPTTREDQLRLNVERSPGLREVDAPVISYLHARSPAEALEQSLPHIGVDWVLMCHQDVYFPTGFGRRLNELLASIDPADAPRTLIGFAGMGVDSQRSGYEQAGFVIDRGSRFDHPPSVMAVSIDEFAIVVSRDSVHRIDPQMGWHLWATDLCLAAICEHKVFPHIVRLPLFHNSVNDYQLPPSFHAAGRRLAAKYPGFGPIHTLCGVIPNPAPVVAAAAPPPSAGKVTGLCAELEATERAIDRAMLAGDFDAALQQMVAGVHRHYRLPEIAHHALFYPNLDARLVQLADRLATLQPLPQPHNSPRGQLLIATELYALGGHTRVLADVVAELENPTVVLTDLFGSCEQDLAQIDWVRGLFPQASVQVLVGGTRWQKCEALRRLTLELNPHSIVYFGHHQDPIPYVATLASPAPNKVFIHHGDHNPSLGCTIERLRHVDLSDGVRDVCASQLPVAPTTLPLHVADLGAKAFAVPVGLGFSVVTSGHPAKFSRSGPIALQQIVLTTLHASTGRHFHIGPLDDDWVAEIRTALQTHAIDPARFVHLGWVPSLWASLKALDAAFYIGSAPLGGGRAAVEAQGCGYPIVYFENGEHTALPANYPLYASRELKWSTTTQLAEVLTAAVGRHTALSVAARALYERGFSRAPFRRAVSEMLNLA